MNNKRPARKYIDPEAFYIARRRAGLNNQEAAKMLDVDVKTLVNWQNGNTRIPYAAFRLMRLSGGYGLLNDGWEGWALWEGKLFAPTGRSFEPHELTYLSNYLSMARMFIHDHKKQSEASRAQAPVDAPPLHLDATIQRGNASSATALAGVSRCHEAVVIHVDFSRQKGGRELKRSLQSVDSLA